jgi:hypothetical protein
MTDHFKERPETASISFASVKASTPVGIRPCRHHLGHFEYGSIESDVFNAKEHLQGVSYRKSLLRPLGTSSIREVVISEIVA